MTYTIDAPLTGTPSLAPPGLVLAETNNPEVRVLRTHSGWVNTNNTVFRPHTTEFATEQYKVLALPDNHRRDTLTRFIQRFRTTTIGASHANSINLSQVERALTGIGAMDAETPISIGMLVHFCDHDLSAQLPTGTVLRAGRGDMWELQAWYVKAGAGRGFSHIMGPVRMTNHDLLTVHSIPGHAEPEAWIAEEYDESMQAEIDAFKDRAYDLGLKAKSAHGWCGEYEVAMDRMGINAVWHNRPRPMTPEVVQALALGTVLLRYDVEDPARFTYYRRVEEGDDVWGLTVLHTTVEDWGVPAESDAALAVAQATDLNELKATIIDPAMWAALPLGSTVRTTHHTLTRINAGWSEVPFGGGGTVNIHDYMPYLPTVTHFGSGTWVLGSTLTDEVLDEQPDGMTILSFRNDPRTASFRVRENGAWRTLAEGPAQHGMGAGHLVIGMEPGEATLSQWQWMDWLPVGSVVADRHSTNTYTRTPRGWTPVENRANALATENFAGMCRAGRARLASVPEEPVDARIGQPLTQEMIDAGQVPPGSTIYGVRSSRMYVSSSGGLSMVGRSRVTPWHEYGDALRRGDLIIQTIGAEVADTDWSHNGVAVGTRLTTGTDLETIDTLPPGSELFGHGSRHTYVREGVRGWRDLTANLFYQSVSEFSPRNCTVHSLGSLTGDGSTVVENDTPKDEYP